MKRLLPWIVAAVAVVLLLRRRGVGIPNLIAGGSFTPGPGAVGLGDLAAGAKQQVSASDAVTRARELTAAVRQDPAVGYSLGFSIDTIKRIILGPAQSAVSLDADSDLKLRLQEALSKPS